MASLCYALCYSYPNVLDILLGVFCGKRLYNMPTAVNYVYLPSILSFLTSIYCWNTKWSSSWHLVYLLMITGPATSSTGPATTSTGSASHFNFLCHNLIGAYVTAHWVPYLLLLGTPAGYVDSPHPHSSPHPTRQPYQHFFGPNVPLPLPNGSTHPADAVSLDLTNNGNQFSHQVAAEKVSGTGSISNYW